MFAAAFKHACGLMRWPLACRGAATASSQLMAKWRHLLSLPGEDGGALPASQLRALLADALAVRIERGEAGIALPDEVSEVFMAAYDRIASGGIASRQQQLAFFTLIAREFGVQGRAVDDAVEAWRQRRHGVEASTGPELTYRLAERLVAAAAPSYLQLLLPISQHREGIGFLVRLRADLLQLLQDAPGSQDAAALRALSRDLRAALARWFSAGLLRLERITWEATPGVLLERVMAAEAVHPMSHVDDLKRRLQQSDRRVYAFLHPSLPLQPLVVLHTAVLRHVPSCMEDIHSASSGSSSAGSLDVDDGNGSRGRGSSGSRGSGRDSSSSSSSSVACFYSVSLAAPGLAGVDLGNALIKTAAAALLSELPGLKTLVTLSPLPGLRAWLVTQLRQEAGSGGVVTPLLSGKEAALVLDAAESLRSSSRGAAAATQTQQPQTPAAAAAAAASSPGAVSSASALLALLERDAWLALPAAQLHALHQLWARLAAQYLLTQRRRGLALDPVQHFHLRCGASLLRICPAADLSADGLARSMGVMVNYSYQLADVAANNRTYLVDRRIMAAPEVWALLHSDGSAPAAAA